MDLKSKQFTFMGSPMHSLTLDETVVFVHDKLKAKEAMQQVVVNVAKLVKMQKDKELYDSVVTSDLINVDGMGVVLGAKLCGHPVPERVAGIDVMMYLLDLCNKEGYKPYFLGAKQEVLDEALDAVRLGYPDINIAGSRHGYFTEEDEGGIVKEIARTKADMLFIGITSPIKERFMARHKKDLNTPFIMGVGGSLDILAGKTKRAPRWMQKHGMEWLYRIYQEPRRMWKRYAVTNSLFALMLIREFFAPKKDIF